MQVNVRRRSAGFNQLFGSKAEVFADANTHCRTTCGRAPEPLTDASPDPWEAVGPTLSRSIAMRANKRHPPGCTMVPAAPISDCDDPAHRREAERRDITRSRVLDRVRQAVAEGAPPSGTDAEAMAGLVHEFLMSISAQARDGVPADTMQRSADALLPLWETQAETVVAENKAKQ